MASQDRELLEALVRSVSEIQKAVSTLSDEVHSVNERVNNLSDSTASVEENSQFKKQNDVPTTPSVNPTSSGLASGVVSAPARKSVNSSRIILTTYPGQNGIEPVPMNWGEYDPAKRGPVVVSRAAGTVKKRNGKQIAIPRPVSMFSLL
jgi:hypothetical protein